MLSEQLLNELKKILLGKYGLVLNDAEVKEIAIFLHNVYEVLLGVDND